MSGNKYLRKIYEITDKGDESTTLPGIHTQPDGQRGRKKAQTET